MMPEDDGDRYYNFCTFPNVRWTDLFIDSMMNENEFEKARNGVTSLLASGHQGADKEKRGEWIRLGDSSPSAGSIGDSSGHLMLLCNRALAHQDRLECVEVNRGHCTCRASCLVDRFYKVECFPLSIHLIKQHRQTSRNLVNLCSSQK